MVRSRKLHWSFAGGEVSPEMFGQAEDASFQIGTAKSQNFILTPHGPARRRPGFEWMANAGVSTKASRLIPFVYSSTDTLMVEVALGFFRFYDNDGLVDAFNPTANPPAFISDETGTFTIWSDVNGEITLGTNLYIGGETVQVSGSVPLPLESGVNYYVVYTLATEIKLSTVPGGAPITGLPTSGTVTVHRSYLRAEVVTATGPTVYYYCTHPNLGTVTSNTAYWYALSSSDLRIPHGYQEDHIFELQYTQSADVLTIAHPMYPTVELRRFGPTNWDLRWVSFSSEILAPTGISVTPTYGRKFDIQAVTDTSSRSYLHFETPHELGEGDGIFLDSVTGFTTNPSGYYVATETQIKSFGGLPAGHITGIKDKDTGTYFNGGALSGGVAGTLRYTPISADSDSTYVVTAIDKSNIESLASSEVTASDNVLYVEGSYNTITFSLVSSAVRYKIYKKQSGLFGYIGQVDDDESASYTFKDDNIAPDMGVTPGVADTALSPTSATVTVAIVDPGVVTYTNHTMSVGDPFWFTSLAAGGAGLTEWKRYLVGGTVTPSSFEIYDEDGTTTVNVTGTYGSSTLSTGDFPGAVAYFEQRRIFAGSREVPQGLWMTRTGTESDMRYSLPVKDDDRVSVVISSRQASTVKHIIPLDHLLLLTDSTEYRVTPLNDDAITPSSISVRPQSYIGSSSVRPMVANSTIVFCAARGGHVREMGFQAASQGFVTGDLSLRAAHLFDDYTISDASQMKAPHSVLWFVSSSGKLLSLTYIPEESIGGWSWHDTGTSDTFISVAVLPDGDEDRVWAVIKRGSTYSVEKMGPQKLTSLTSGFYVDSGYTETVITSHTYALGAEFPDKTSGAPAENLDGLAHLNGDTVQVLVDGVAYTTQVVGGTTSNKIIMPVAATVDSVITIGLAYTSEIQTLPFTAQTEALGQGIRKNVSKVWIRVYESAPFEVGSDISNLSSSDPYSETTGNLTTDEIDITLFGQWTDDGQIVIRQTNPQPLTVVSATTLVTFGGD